VELLSRTFVSFKKKSYSSKGKVLGAGKANHSITVAAFAFSDNAQSKIQKAKGNCLSIKDLMEKNPEGTNVKVIG
jgi:large subunit ribosomal protein L18e